VRGVGFVFLLNIREENPGASRPPNFEKGATSCHTTWTDKERVLSNILIYSELEGYETNDRFGMTCIKNIAT
jgi:hypothetical protein